MKIILLMIMMIVNVVAMIIDYSDDNNGLVQFHILVSSKLSIVSLKVFTVTRLPLLLFKGPVNLSSFGSLSCPGVLPHTSAFCSNIVESSMRA